MALKKKKKEEEEEEEATATSPHTRYTQYFEGVVPTSFSACRCGRVVRRLTCPTQVDSETNNVGTHNETHRLRSQLMYFIYIYIYMYFVSCPEVFLEILKMAHVSPPNQHVGTVHVLLHYWMLPSYSSCARESHPTKIIILPTISY